MDMDTRPEPNSHVFECFHPRHIFPSQFHRRSCLYCWAPCLASSSARSLPRIPLCAGTYCHFIFNCGFSWMARSKARKSVSLRTGWPSAFLHPRDFHPFIHSVTALMTKCESEFMHNLVTSLAAASVMALVAAWISPRLLVGGPTTGADVFLFKNNKLASILLWSTSNRTYNACPSPK